MSEQIISYAQNGEDVVLWRALQDVRNGCYLEIGANDPVTDSITKLFYDRGWSGVTIEPVAEFADRHRRLRDRDTLVQAVVTDSGADRVVFHQVPGTGLSTMDEEIAREHAEGGFEVVEIEVEARPLQAIVDEHLAETTVHFCCLDVEGAEAQVLRSIDLASFRPWVLVIEATRPRSTEQAHDEWESIVTDAGYRFCLFDGLSRYYVADEHADLADRLSYSASRALDGYVTAEVEHLREQVNSARHHGDVLDEQLNQAATEHEEVQRQLDELRQQVVYWRGQVLAHWVRAAAQAQPSGPAVDPAAARELDAIRQTVSWRVTAPLRKVRRHMPGGA